jgi:hypothetical protein
VNLDDFLWAVGRQTASWHSVGAELVSEYGAGGNVLVRGAFPKRRVMKEGSSGSA